MNTRQARMIREGILAARTGHYPRIRSGLFRRAYRREILGIHARQLRFYREHGVTDRIIVRDFDSLAYPPLIGQMVWVLADGSERMGDGIHYLAQLPNRTPLSL